MKNVEEIINNALETTKYVEIKDVAECFIAVVECVGDKINLSSDAKLSLICSFLETLNQNCGCDNIMVCRDA